MLTGTITRQHQRQRPVHDADGDECGDRDQRADDGAIAKQRPHHFGDRRHHQAGRRRRDAGQRAAQPRQVAVITVNGADDEDQNHRRAEQSGQRRRAAERSAEASAEYDREIDDIAARQEAAQRVDLVELLGRHPLAFIDHHAPRPGQDAAEAGQRDLGEGDEDLGKVWRCRGGFRDGIGAGTGLPARFAAWLAAWGSFAAGIGEAFMRFV